MAQRLGGRRAYLPAAVILTEPRGKNYRSSGRVARSAFNFNAPASIVSQPDVDSDARRRLIGNPKFPLPDFYLGDVASLVYVV